MQKSNKILLCSLLALVMVLACALTVIPTANTTASAADNFENKFSLIQAETNSSSEAKNDIICNSIEGSNTLAITPVSKVYLAGDDGLKIGSSKASGSFKIKVPSDVVTVILTIKKYSNDNGKVKVGDTQFTPQTAATEFEYNVVDDDLNNDELTIATTDKRAYFQYVEFVYGNVTPTTVTPTIEYANETVECATLTKDGVTITVAPADTSTTDFVVDANATVTVTGVASGSTVKVNDNSATANDSDAYVATVTISNPFTVTVTVTAPHVHNLVKVDRQEATCTATGNKEYWRCDVEGCGALFDDAEGNTATTIDDVTIAMADHDFTKYVHNDGTHTHKIVCSVCDTVKTGSDKVDCSGGTATCQNKAVCADCGAEYGELGAHTYADGVCTECGNPQPAAQKFVLVTDASTLKAGDKIIIVSTAKNVALSELSNQTFSAVDVKIENNTISLTDENVAVLTLGGAVGAWTFENSGKLLGATAVKKLAWDEGTTTWSISIADDNATIQNGTSTYGRFLHNAGTNRFTTYTSNTNTNMLLPQIYKLEEAPTPVTPTIKVGDETADGFTLTTKGGVTVTVAPVGDGVEQLFKGNKYTVTVTGTDGYNVTVKDGETQLALVDGKYEGTVGATVAIEVILTSATHTHTFTTVDEVGATCYAEGTKAHKICTDSNCTGLKFDIDTEEQIAALSTLVIEKKEHTPTYVTNEGKGTHNVVCEVEQCKAVIEKDVACSGGTATCQKKAECTLCHAEYGSLAAHNYVDGVCKDCDAKQPASVTILPSHFASGGYDSNNTVTSLTLGSGADTYILSVKVNRVYTNSNSIQMEAKNGYIVLKNVSVKKVAIGVKTNSVTLKGYASESDAEQDANGTEIAIADGVASVNYEYSYLRISTGSKYAQLNSIQLVFTEPECQHTNTTKTERKEATCTTDGNIEYWTCGTCGKKFSDEGCTTVVSDEEIVLAKGNHTATKVDAKAATCTAEGNVEHWHCSVCGKNFDSVECTNEIAKVTIDKVAHDFSGTESNVVPATCTTAGSKTVQCKNCDATTNVEIVIDENAHTWNDGEQTKAPTCSEKGVKTFTCTHNASHTKTEDVAIDENAHEWQDGDVITEATCTTAGEQTLVCKHNSAHTSTKTLDATGHDSDPTHTTKVDATCGVAGNKDYWTCGKCHKNFDSAGCTTEVTDVVIPATGEHTWVESPSESTKVDGVDNTYYKSCSVCGAKSSETFTYDPTAQKFEISQTIAAGDNTTTNGNSIYLVSGSTITVTYTITANSGINGLSFTIVHDSRFAATKVVADDNFTLTGTETTATAHKIAFTSGNLYAGKDVVVTVTYTLNAGVESLADLAFGLKDVKVVVGKDYMSSDKVAVKLDTTHTLDLRATTEVTVNGKGNGGTIDLIYTGSDLTVGREDTNNLVVASANSGEIVATWKKGDVTVANAKDAGTYTLTIAITGDASHADGHATFTVVVAPITIDVDKIAVTLVNDNKTLVAGDATWTTDDISIVYTGTTPDAFAGLYNVALTNNTIAQTASNLSQEMTVTITLTNANYTLSEGTSVERKLTIKAVMTDITLSGIPNSTTKAYDKVAIDLSKISCEQTGVTIVVTVNGNTVSDDALATAVTNAGTYNVVITASGTGYKTVTVERTYTINKAGLEKIQLTYNGNVATWTNVGDIVVTYKVGETVLTENKVVAGATKTTITVVSSDANYEGYTVDTKDTVAIKFVDNGADVATQYTFVGETTTAAPAPTHDGQTFKCWTATANGTTAFDFATTIDTATTLYAYYSSTLTINYYYNGSLLADETKTVAGVDGYKAVESIKMPTTVSATWLTFDGYYTDSTFVTKFATMPNSNTTVYARYVFTDLCGDVDGSGTIDNNDVMLYRLDLVGGYTIVHIAAGDEFATAKSYVADTKYFFDAVANVDGDEDDTRDIRDAAVIAMAMVNNGYTVDTNNGVVEKTSASEPSAALDTTVNAIVYAVVPTSKYAW